jgi:predicted  nucleic acid-binding Zn-ribbon protein
MNLNPFDALLVPPALVKRALDDLHDIAQIARRLAGLEDEVRERVDQIEQDARLLNMQLGATVAAVEPLSAQIAHMELQLDGLMREMLPIQQLPLVREAVEPLSGQIGHMEGQLDGLAEEMAPIGHLDAIRHGIEPLEHSMVAVRESVDELEPMIADLDKKIQLIEPRLEEMQESVEPIGDLAERIPGNRRRRSR